MGNEISGFFYLSKRKGFLFTKRSVPENALKEWRFDDEETTVGAMWRIAIEAVALGAKPNEVARALKRWNLNESSAVGFAKRCGIKLGRVPSPQGVCLKAPEWIASFERFPKGVPPQIKFGSGETPLEAMADLTEAGIYLQSQKQLAVAVSQ